MLEKLKPQKVYNPTWTRFFTTLVAAIPGIVALVVAYFTFRVSINYFPLTTSLPTAYQLGQQLKLIDWDLLGSITSLATFSLVMGGLVFASINYVQNAVQRKREESVSAFNMYKEMYDRIMNPESMEARRWVIVNLPTLEEMNNDPAAWFECIKSRIEYVPSRSRNKRAQGKDYLKQILNDFDFIGFVDRNYWKMEVQLTEWMSSPIAKVWERIHLYVEKEAEERTEPDYYKYARDLGTQCVEWRRKRKLRSIVIPDGT